MHQPDTRQQRMAAVFNEWARRLSENPELFGEILDADGNPIEDYGVRCAAYFSQIHDELHGSGALSLMRIPYLGCSKD